MIPGLGIMSGVLSFIVGGVWYLCEVFGRPAESAVERFDAERENSR